MRRANRANVKERAGYVTHTHTHTEGNRPAKQDYGTAASIEQWEQGAQAYGSTQERKHIARREPASERVLKSPAGKYTNPCSGRKGKERKSKTPFIDLLWWMARASGTLLCLRVHLRDMARPQHHPYIDHNCRCRLPLSSTRIHWRSKSCTHLWDASNRSTGQARQDIAG